MKFGLWAAACLVACIIAVLFMTSGPPTEILNPALESESPQSEPSGTESSVAESSGSEVSASGSSKTEESASGAVSGNGKAALVDRSLTKVNRSVPDFELEGIDGITWTDETLKGKPWIINFWASWCAPCIEEIPSMNAAYEILIPQGIDMLAINAGEGGDAVNEFLEKVAIEFPNVLGGANTLQNWSVRGLPTTIIVTADGEVIYEALGPREWDDAQLLQQVVDSL